ncbi:MAG: hypothetical protein HYZ22_17410 [Chloroflexi bacterium]|nr:hypothetical protein [Chloroflexota bacterium]
MIEITFKEFYELNYQEDAFHDLYVMKNGNDEVLYVGISSQKIWDRWFGWNGHIFDDHLILIGKSSIGQKVVDNLPDSWCWKIQLWTLDDCVAFCKDEISPTRAYYDIKYLEPFMIEKLRPVLNVLYNQNPGKDSTPKSEKEKRIDKILDKAYYEVFEKNSRWGKDKT